MFAYCIMWILPMGFYGVYLYICSRHKKKLARLDDILELQDDGEFIAALKNMMMEQIERLGHFQKYLPERKGGLL